MDRHSFCIKHQSLSVLKSKNSSIALDGQNKSLATRFSNRSNWNNNRGWAVYFIIEYCDHILLYQVDGGYSDWGQWNQCSVTCGGGSRLRNRSCTNPPPQHGGADCSSLGPIQETGTCNESPCPGKHPLNNNKKSNKKVK